MGMQGLLSSGPEWGLCKSKLQNLLFSRMFLILVMVL